MSKPFGTIAHLHLSPGHRLPMLATHSARAVADLGLEGDAHARRGSARQILLMDEETLERYGLEAGRVRENITTRGIELKTLAEGTHLKIGEAILEITKHCAPCEFIEDIRPGLRAEMDGQRGMLARVISGGEIQVGNAIEIQR
jgi:MOSC domain-containing protein YiiM